MVFDLTLLLIIIITEICRLAGL